MADPALYVVVRQGRHEFRLDRSGALSLPGSLFDGPDAWAKPSGRVEVEPYDEGAAYGGVLLDHDRRLLRWYNRMSIADDSAGLRRAILPLLARYWPGWTVRHAERGYADLIDGLLVDRTALLRPDPAPREVTVAELLDGVAAPSSVLDQPLSLDEYLAEVDPFTDLIHLRGYGLTVLSVREVDGTVRDYVGGMSLRDVLATGPQLLTMLRDLPTAALPGEQYVGDGAWIDAQGRTVTAWQSRSGRHLESAGLAERWPGWRLSVHHDGLPGHVRRCGRDDAPLRLPWTVTLAEACLLFTLDPKPARDKFAGLLRGGTAWSAMTGRPLEVLHHLYAARPLTHPQPSGRRR